MTGLDTSVVLRLLTGEPSDQAARAEQLLDALFERSEQAVVSDLVVAESYFALQHHYGVPKGEAVAALRSLLESGEIVSSGVAGEVLKTSGLASAKPGFVDRLIHDGYRRRGYDMATFEKAAAKWNDTRVL